MVETKAIKERYLNEMLVNVSEELAKRVSAAAEWVRRERTWAANGLAFDRQKILSGLLSACSRRPIPASLLEKIVDETEAIVVDSPDRERSTAEIGERIMDRLREIDKVAYIRFASVHRDFKDSANSRPKSKASSKSSRSQLLTNTPLRRRNANGSSRHN